MYNPSKYLIACFALLFMGVCSTTSTMQAQERPGLKEDYSLRKNHLSFDPILPLFDTWQLQYERPVLPRVSVSLTAGYKFSSGILNTDEISIGDFQMNEFGVSGVKLITEVRWYLNPNDSGIFGFYTGVYYRYQGRSGDIAGDYTDNLGEVQSDPHGYRPAHVKLGPGNRV